MNYHYTSFLHPSFEMTCCYLTTIMHSTIINSITVCRSFCEEEISIEMYFSKMCIIIIDHAWKDILRQCIYDQGRW